MRPWQIACKGSDLGKQHVGGQGRLRGELLQGQLPDFVQLPEAGVAGQEGSHSVQLRAGFCGPQLGVAAQNRLQEDLRERPAAVKAVRQQGILFSCC